jgi:hypothetical protein
MPGISIYYNNNNKDLTSLDLNVLNSEKHYSTEVLYKNDDIIIAKTGYDGYPIEYFETQSAIVVIEGLIYNKSEQELKETLSKIVACDESSVNNEINMFIHSFHGDYIVYLYHIQKNELKVFNDLWGRLKTQYYYDHDMLLISREHTFILDNLPEITLNKNAILELILFRFYMEGKTIISNVFKTPPSTLIRAKKINDNLSVSIETNKHDLTTTKFFSGRKKFIKKYTDIYLSSLRDTIKTLQKRKLKLVGDLSGGLDSRAVFYGICNITKDAEFFTDDLISGDESRCAEHVAAQYNMKLTKIKASHEMDINDMSRITFLTGCTVNAVTNLACYLDNIERKNIEKSPAVKFQGFGGDFIRHPYRHIKGYRSLTSLFKNNFLINGINFKEAEKLLNIDNSNIINHFTQIENRYPEHNVEDRVKHFYFDYYNGLVYSGEDRARMHFWTIQPMMAHNLLSLSLYHIPRNKINTELFVNFLKLLDKKSLNSPLHNYSFKLNSPLSIKLQSLKESINAIIKFNMLSRLISRRINETVNRKNKSKFLDDPVILEALKLYKRSKILQSIFDKSAIEKVFSKSCKSNIKPIITIILYVSELEKRYRDKLK